MKKFLALVMALAIVVCCFAACGPKNPSNEPTDSANPEVTDSATPADGVLDYAGYVAAPIDSKVTVETYVQAKQSWWEDKATVYTQDENGAYFLYEMACSEADYALLVPGTKIKVTGTKAEWSGEVEIVDATFEILEGEYKATALDVTSLLADEKLIEKQNMFVAFKGMTIEAYKEGSEAAFEYKNEKQGDDIYFKASVDGATYDFCIESYLTGADTDVYKAVEALKVGDKVDMEGFLYWYNGVNPHITAVTVAA